MEWIHGITAIGGAAVTAVLFLKHLRTLYKEAMDVYKSSTVLHAFYERARSDGKWSEQEFHQMGAMAADLAIQCNELKDAIKSLRKK